MSRCFSRRRSGSAPMRHVPASDRPEPSQFHACVLYRGHEQRNRHGLGCRGQGLRARAVRRGGFDAGDQDGCSARRGGRLGAAGVGRRSAQAHAGRSASACRRGSRLVLPPHALCLAHRAQRHPDDQGPRHGRGCLLRRHRQQHGRRRRLAVRVDDGHGGPLRKVRPDRRCHFPEHHARPLRLQVAQRPAGHFRHAGRGSRTQLQDGDRGGWRRV